MENEQKKEEKFSLKNILTGVGITAAIAGIGFYLGRCSKPKETFVGIIERERKVQ